jgi:UDP-GlcNAc:undecaprenyl-phosphate GlcNAc-1-phosphate transferase
MTSELLTDPVWYALAFLTSLGLVLYVTPLTIRVARTFKIQDTPDGRLKKHTAPTPYLGGLAIAAAFMIAFGLFSTTATTTGQATGILVGGFMVLLLGLYDDLTNLRPSVKFLGQLLAAVVVYKAGVRVAFLQSEWANMAVTVLWVTGIANAFNIIDVMDGIAAGTALIAAAFLFVISAAATYFHGEPRMVPFMAITLSGALLGYLRFNYHPARIFLGDTGSLFIGFMLGALTMVTSYSETNQLAVVTPVVLLTIPIFDTLFVALHRARKGIPFFRGSPDHFVLRLRNAGMPIPLIARKTYSVAIILGALSLCLVYGDSSAIPWLLGLFSSAVVAAALLFSRLPSPPRVGVETPTGGPEVEA